MSYERKIIQQFPPVPAEVGRATSRLPASALNGFSAAALSATAQGSRAAGGIPSGLLHVD